MFSGFFWEVFVTSQCLSAPTVPKLLVKVFKPLVKVLSFWVLHHNKESFDTLWCDLF